MNLFFVFCRFDLVVGVFFCFAEFRYNRKCAKFAASLDNIDTYFKMKSPYINKAGKLGTLIQFLKGDTNNRLFKQLNQFDLAFLHIMTAQTAVYCEFR